MSVCPQCAGTGFVIQKTRTPASRDMGSLPTMPCDYPGCSSGLIYCCEGDCSQPDAPMHADGHERPPEWPEI